MMLSSTLKPAAIALLCLLARTSSAQAQCYNRNGGETGPATVPCNRNDENSPCCDSNKGTPDLCTSSGLCYAQQSSWQGLLYMNGCTDKTFKSKSCVTVCDAWLEKQELKDWNGIYNLLQCSRDKFCCRTTNDDSNCCDNKDAVVEFQIGEIQLPTSTVTSTRTATATTKVTVGAGDDEESVESSTARNSAATTEASGGDSQTCANASSVEGQPDSQGCKSNNDVAIVAGTLGGVLGAALLASLGVIFILWKKQHKANKTPVPVQGPFPPPPPFDHGYDHGYDHAGAYKYVTAPPSTYPPSEMENRNVHELQH